MTGVSVAARNAAGLGDFVEIQVQCCHPFQILAVENEHHLLNGGTFCLSIFLLWG